MGADPGVTWRDGAVPLLVLGIGAVEATAYGGTGLRTALALELAACALLVLRRSRPMLVAPAAIVLVLSMSRLGGPKADESPRRSSSSSSPLSASAAGRRTGADWRCSSRSTCSV